jgi:hypothetical protein
MTNQIHETQGLVIRRAPFDVPVELAPGVTFTVRVKPLSHADHEALTLALRSACAEAESAFDQWLAGQLAPGETAAEVLEAAGADDTDAGDGRVRAFTAKLTVAALRGYDLAGALNRAARPVQVEIVRKAVRGHSGLFDETGAPWPFASNEAGEPGEPGPATLALYTETAFAGLPLVAAIARAVLATHAVTEGGPLAKKSSPPQPARPTPGSTAAAATGCANG